MMVLWLQPDQADQLVARAYADLPRETCGLIAGTRRGNIDQAAEIIPIPNCAPDPVHAYRMDERALAAALIGLEKRGLALVGIYHSHPQGSPIPSQQDILQAAYPDTAYLLIGMKDGAPQLAAWQISSRAVERVELHVGANPPPHQTPPRAAQTSILIAGAVAFIFLIAVSLSLLPPAPEIPR
jgi:proteasome lid subunit RPN8/RPN11